MKKDSIFFKINLLFITALVAILITYFFVLQAQKRYERKEQFLKIKMLIKDIQKHHTISKDTLNFLDAKIILEPKKSYIISSGKKLKRAFIKRPRIRLKVFLIRFKGKNYYLIKIPRESYLIDIKNGNRIFYTTTVFVALIGFLIAIYLLIIKSLKPLKVLEKDIKNYIEGKQLEPKYIDNQDEIAKINNAFYEYATKAAKLSKSRELFIRNIFHELNTPVTKGKILSELTEDKKIKTKLESIFNRLESLLKELANIEKISSNNYKLNKIDIPIVELIDSAKELLYLDNINHNITSQKIYGDYEALVIVFKNLIENGIKYGKDFKIEYKDNKICFLSKGEKLQKPLEYYTQAFISENGSFGLGLYITKEILNMHNYDLEYNYINGINNFCITMKNK